MRPGIRRWWCWPNPPPPWPSELRRLIPELRTLVGDDRRVLVGFDRGGWSPTLFADVHAAGFDTLTCVKGLFVNEGAPVFSGYPRESVVSMS
jgi:hypothetical protein